MRIFKNLTGKTCEWCNGTGQSVLEGGHVVRHEAGVVVIRSVNRPGSQPTRLALWLSNCGGRTGTRRNSPAERAKLAAGDIITAMNGVSVEAEKEEDLGNF